MISAVMVAFNEEYTVDLAIKAIADTADYLIFVDNGSEDNTLDVVKQTMDEVNLEVAIYEKPNLDLASVRYFSFQQALYDDTDWIWLVDADHVVRDTDIVEHVVANKPDYPVQHGFKFINLYGDFEHTWSQQQVAPPHAVLFSTDAEFLHAKHCGRRNTPHTPGRVRTNHDVYAVNCNGLKHVERMYYRRAFIEWQEAETDITSPKEFFMDKHDIADDEELSRLAHEWALTAFNEQCIPLEEHFMQPAHELLPQIIVDELNDPRLKLLYDDDVIVGRHPDVNAEAT